MGLFVPKTDNPNEAFRRIEEYYSNKRLVLSFPLLLACAVFILLTFVFDSMASLFSYFVCASLYAVIMRDIRERVEKSKSQYNNDFCLNIYLRLNKMDDTIDDIARRVELTRVGSTGQERRIAAKHEQILQEETDAFTFHEIGDPNMGCPGCNKCKEKAVVNKSEES